MTDNTPGKGYGLLVQDLQDLPPALLLIIALLVIALSLIWFARMCHKYDEKHPCHSCGVTHRETGMLCVLYGETIAWICKRCYRNASEEEKRKISVFRARRK